MICPKCEAEYLDGYDECADCRVPLVTLEALVAQRKAVAEANPMEHVPVRVTADSGHILFLQSVLDGEGIAYYWHSDHTSMYQFQTPGKLMMVDVKKLDDLRQIFADLEIESDLSSPTRSDDVEADRNDEPVFADEETFPDTELSIEPESPPQSSTKPQTIDDLLKSSDIEGFGSDDDAFKRED